jgi:large subunit ribosomal protein L21
LLEHGRTKKIVVYKKKRRKGYENKNTHRQGFSILEIQKIEAKKAPAKKTTAKTETKTKAKSTTKKAAKKPKKDE